MKVSLFLAVFLAIFSIAFSAVAFYPKVPGKPGHCWAEDTGPMKNGETKKVEKECAQATCKANKTIFLATCGKVLGPNGTTKGDNSKPYPECCPQPA